VDIDWRPLKDLIREFPGITNQEANKAYRKVASWFGKEFTKNRLRRGIFNPHRKVKMSKTPKGQPAIPVKMRKAGFVARLTGASKIEGKAVRVGSGSDLIIQREGGRVVRADPKKRKPNERYAYLYIRATGSKMGYGKAKKDQARVDRWAKRKGRMSKTRQRWALPIVAKVRQAGPWPKLGFEAAWRAFEPRRDKILQDLMPAEIVRRAQLRLERRRAA
jgi:hypothetical protein